jgi:hypothetical protein
MIDYDLADYIQAGTEIESIVGERVWPNKQPDMVSELYPCILVFREATNPVYDMDGESGMSHARFEVVSMATSYMDAKDLSDLVKDRIAGFRGTMGGTTVDSIIRTGDSDFLNMRNNVKTAFFAVAQEYQVHFRE